MLSLHPVRRALTGSHPWGCVRSSNAADRHATHAAAAFSLAPPTLHVKVAVLGGLTGFLSPFTCTVVVDFWHMSMCWQLVVPGGAAQPLTASQSASIVTYVGRFDPTISNFPRSLLFHFCLREQSIP